MIFLLTSHCNINTILYEEIKKKGVMACFTVVALDHTCESDI